MKSPKVALIYLCWADEPKKYLTRTLEAVSRQNYSKENILLVIVYNGPRPGEASQSDYINEEVRRMQSVLPETRVLISESNLGFAGGNNYGARFAVEEGADYIFLHNADGYLGDSAVAEMVKVMEADKTIGECQPLMLLYPETGLVNSAGNRFHYLGIGYCSEYRKPKRVKYEEFEPAGYVSGAAAFMRADLLKKYGYWCDEFFLYHEDTEYSLRLKIRDYKIGLAGNAVFYHQYDFSNKPGKFFWIERNRHALKLIFYRWPTLLLMLPLEIAYNIGLLFLAFLKGWQKEVFKVYAYWFKPRNWSFWLNQRKITQRERLVSDSRLISEAAVFIGYGDLALPPPVRVCVNFVFTLYWILLKILIWW